MTVDVTSWPVSVSEGGTVNFGDDDDDDVPTTAEDGSNIFRGR